MNKRGGFSCRGCNISPFKEHERKKKEGWGGGKNSGDKKLYPGSGESCFCQGEEQRGLLKRHNKNPKRWGGGGGGKERRGVDRKGWL